MFYEHDSDKCSDDNAKGEQPWPRTELPVTEEAKAHQANRWHEHPPRSACDIAKQ